MPALHILVGPNGAGKSTFYERVLGPATHLPFVNADVIARALWPGDEMAHAYAASARATDERARLLASRTSFSTETVFSHPSKVALLREAKQAGYAVHLHVVVIPVELAVLRVRLRQEQGGHAVPEQKIRERFGRLWLYVEEALAIADEVTVYDNTRADAPFRVVARYVGGAAVLEVLPRWLTRLWRRPSKRRR